MKHIIMQKAKGREHLAPKKIQVTRGGKTFQMTVWMRPGTYSVKTAKEQYPESKVEVVSVAPSKGAVTREGKPLQTEHYVQVQSQQEGKGAFFKRKVKEGELIISYKGAMVENLHTKDKKVLATFVKDEKGSGYDVTEAGKEKMRTNLEGALDKIHHHLKAKETERDQMERQFFNASKKGKKK